MSRTIHVAIECMPWNVTHDHAVRFAYDRGMVQAFKDAVPYAHRIWDADQRVWWTTEAGARIVCDLFAGLGCDVRWTDVYGEKPMEFPELPPLPRNCPPDPFGQPPVFGTDLDAELGIGRDCLSEPIRPLTTR
jgi:hypothetical protein